MGSGYGGDYGGGSVGDIVDLTTEVTGTLPVASGGTGVTTKTGTGSVVLNTSPTIATGATLSFCTSNGGILYTNGSGVVAQVAAGTTVQVLHGGTSPSFSAVSLTADVTGTLPVANGGTGLASYAAGDILYATGATTLAKLAAGTNGHYLTLAAGLPSWAAVTGITGLTAARIPVAASATTLTDYATLTYDGTTATTAVAAIGTGTTTPAVHIQNTTAATGGATQQYSPTLRLSGNYWNGSASKTDNWDVYNYANNGNGGPALAFAATNDGSQYAGRLGFYYSATGPSYQFGSVTNTDWRLMRNLNECARLTNDATKDLFRIITHGQVSIASVASYPAFSIYGAWVTGGSATTNKPHLSVEPTGTTSNNWNTSGTGIGINAAAAFAGNLLDMQIASSRVCRIDSTGLIMTSGTYVHHSTVATITASTTQTQGNGALTAELNEVSVCANANDTVTLPVAVAGRIAIVINNGAQTLQVFPASGDNLGGGVDTATTIAAGSRKMFAAFDSTNWEPVV